MLNRLLEPKSIAVIGAAREEGKVGHVILDNLIEAGFKGDIYPINPKADEIHGLKTYPSVSAVKGDIDLVIIVTPAKTVETLIEEGGKKGVKNIVVISAGFKEIGIEGARLERQIVKTAKKHGIRLLGPNCLGVINAHIGLNASFTRVGPLKGNIAFISQSGALQTAVLDMSRDLGLGFSKFISLGNKADLDEVDFIQALAADKKTSVICLYLEGVSDGSKFLRVASKIALKKPIIALKAGRTAAGAKAVSSHTGTLAGSEKAYIAAFAQSGVINAASLEQLFSFAKVLSKQRTPRGNKLGIVTNAGGPAILASDFAAKAVLRIESLSGSTINNLAKFLPSAANLYNPVDLLGDAKADRYEKALKIVFSDENVDSVLVILTPQAMTEIDKTAQIVAKAAKNSKKPIVCAFMGGPEIRHAQDILQHNHIPNFIYPEEAVKAIGSLVTYSKIKTRPKARYISYAVNKEKVKKIITEARKANRVNLSYPEANEVLKAYSIEVPKSIFARSSEEAVEGAKEIGFPVAMKIVSAEIQHKTDVGGVTLGLSSTKDVKLEYENMLNNARRLMPQADVEGIIVQEMVTGGQETIVGISRDPQFGPLILFGLGGIYVEILKDVSFRIAPVSTMDVKKMLGEVKSYLLLKGVRGEKAKDVEAIEETILRVSQLVTDFKEIVEMDINPLMVKDEKKGAVAADARMSIRLK
ncbi:hypothetical protein LCGC14_0753290 [marine sediment metagenome]|uniref:ATP-grasp domain-containing protein n=1 Tax=marine sediment metagenome TaxID=412755 RepID=A0A0F9QN66_9ZZZZ